jgi:hypothetical protein
MNFIKNLKNNIQTKFRQYPHAFLLFAFVILAFIVSLANDAYFENLFTVTRIPASPPVIVRPEFIEVVSVTPESGVRQSFDTFMQFTVVFSSPIDPASVKITSKPAHPLGHALDGNKLRVFPRANWVFDRGYEISIEAKSVGGLTLEEPFTYNMYIATPTDGGEFDVY